MKMIMFGPQLERYDLGPTAVHGGGISSNNADTGIWRCSRGWKYRNGGSGVHQEFFYWKSVTEVKERGNRSSRDKKTYVPFGWLVFRPGAGFLSFLGLIFMCSVKPAGDGVRRPGPSDKVGVWRSAGMAWRCGVGAVMADSLPGRMDGVDGGKWVVRKQVVDRRRLMTLE